MYWATRLRSGARWKAHRLRFSRGRQLPRVRRSPRPSQQPLPRASPAVSRESIDGWRACAATHSSLIISSREKQSGLANHRRTTLATAQSDGEIPLSFVDTLNKMIERLDGCSAVVVLGLDGIPIERRGGGIGAVVEPGSMIHRFST